MMSLTEQRKESMYKYAKEKLKRIPLDVQKEKYEEINQKRIERARGAAGVTEEVNTWSGWKALGYEVIHGSRSLFGTELIWGSKGDGATYKARFFGRSQVHEATEGVMV